MSPSRHPGFARTPSGVHSVSESLRASRVTIVLWECPAAPPRSITVRYNVGMPMETGAAAARWAETWQRAWPTRDAEAIELLYAPNASYRSSALADPEPGGVTAYLTRQFAAEQDVQCRFGQPVADRARAAVEWWASWVEDVRPSHSPASPSYGSTSTVESSTTSTTGCRPEADESRTRAGPTDRLETLRTNGSLLTSTSRTTFDEWGFPHRRQRVGNACRRSAATGRIRAWFPTSSSPKARPGDRVAVLSPSFAAPGVRPGGA